VTIARKRKSKKPAARQRKAPAPAQPAPPERRRLAVALSVGEGALALLLTWLLFRSDFAKHASVTVGLGAAELLVLGAMAFCLAFFVFLLAFWQWRLSGRARLRLLVVLFASLLWSFCGYCWHDVAAGTFDQVGPGSRPPIEQLHEETAAVLVTIGALLVGLVAATIILVREHRAAREGA
jgi:hypothetical protein